MANSGTLALTTPSMPFQTGEVQMMLSVTLRGSVPLHLIHMLEFVSVPFGRKFSLSYFGLSKLESYVRCRGREISDGTLRVLAGLLWSGCGHLPHRPSRDSSGERSDTLGLPKRPCPHTLSDVQEFTGHSGECRRRSNAGKSATETSSELVQFVNSTRWRSKGSFPQTFEVHVTKFAPHKVPKVNCVRQVDF